MEHDGEGLVDARERAVDGCVHAFARESGVEVFRVVVRVRGEDVGASSFGTDRRTEGRQAIHPRGDVLPVVNLFNATGQPVSDDGWNVASVTSLPFLSGLVALRRCARRARLKSSIVSGVRFVGSVTAIRRGRGSGRFFVAEITRNSSPFARRSERDYDRRRSTSRRVSATRAVTRLGTLVDDIACNYKNLYDYVRST